MTERSRKRQRGKFNIVTLITLLLISTAGYLSYKFIPVYIEKSRISRLVKQAGNQFLNVDPHIESVKANLQKNLIEGGIDYISADDVNFAPINDRELEVWVDYKVTVKYFWKKIKPTKLKFKIHHKVKRVTTTEG